MNFKEIIYNLSLITISLAFINMGTGERINTKLDPIFTRLEDGEGSFHAIIYNKSNGNVIKTEVIDISFSGKASIGGIKNENDDSHTTLDFSKITKLIIEDSEFESKRYGRKEFILASIIDNDGRKHSNFLIPKNVIICGLTKEGKLEKAWFLKYMQKIEIIRKKNTKPIQEDEKGGEKGLIEKITEYVSG